MKKLLIPAVALTLLGSCNVLQKDPLTFIAPANFYQNATDAEAALTATYDGLQSKGCYSEVLPLLGNMPSDDCTSLNNDVRPLETINWNSTTGQVSDAYRDAYGAINRANGVIKYVPGIDMNTTRRSQIVGEALFIRALMYFNLVRLYGDVPLRLEPSESGSPEALNTPRSATSAVYDQILRDLTTAEGQLAATNATRATKGSAAALLARVYVTLRRWSEAKDAANRVITGGQYQLASDFNSLFPADNRAESIFEIQYSGSTDGGTFHTLPDLLLPQPPATYSFQKFNLPTADLLAAADTVNDLRWKDRGRVNAGHNHASFVYHRSNNAQDNGPFVYKWRSDPNGFNSPDNSYVLRYADVLLLYAEASNELSGPGSDALDKLNQVRQQHGGLGALLLSQPAAATKKSLRDALDLERRRELAFEGERWFDLLRYARHNQAEAGAHNVTAFTLIQQFRNTADANYLLLPLPLAELNTNTQLTQNPGY